ncbi:MAG: tripartite tricarboxylate transporter permease [Blastocatellia bacterium]|nr:tripartite tricarboxylate transporter permease [Blastocatellia bacterium]
MRDILDGLLPVLQSAWAGLELVLSWPNILYPVTGTLLSMMFAFLPGLSGVTLMALAISFTFAWDPLPVILLFGAFVGGATFMGSVTAILFNIPGTAPSAATMIDGYPMACQGQARTAIACSAMSSALGSSFGIFVLILLIPLLRGAVLAVGPPEFLMLAIWGLCTIAALVRGSLIKGLAAAGTGLLLAFVGLDPLTSEARYTFGSTYLRDGLSIIPVFLGLYAGAEMIDLAVTGRATISGHSHTEELAGSIREGLLSVFRHFGLFIRSSIIGTIIGLIPAVGGTVASFVAYGQAVQTARKGRENFGRGDIRGVLAPEAAHDAKDGGSLVPTLAFGIPGSEGTALLLAAMTLHGLVPGKQLLTDNLDLVFALIWSLFFSNWLTSILGVLAVHRLARLTVLRAQVLAPVILALAAIGAFASRGMIEDVVLVCAFAVFGYYMKKHRWPRVPLVIALVLGPLFETNFHITRRLDQLGRINFWSRPLVLVLIALTLITVASTLAQSRKRSRTCREDDAQEL